MFVRPATLRSTTLLVILCPVILIGVGGCDNVEWGGVEWSVAPPEAPSHATFPDDADLPDAASEPLDLGPTLFVVERGADGAIAYPIAEMGEGGFQDLPVEEDEPRFQERFLAQRLSPGAELALFHRGGRMGSFIAQEASEPVTGHCRSRPAVSGAVELQDGVGQVQRFLALSKGEHPPFFPATHLPLQEDDSDRAAAVTVATRLLGQLGAPWPPSVPDILEELQLIPLGEGPEPSLTSSFLYGDEMEPGEASSLAYSLFFLASVPEAGAAPEAVWYWYQREDGGGKAWPRLVGTLPQEEGHSPDLVLEIVGRDTNSFAILSSGNGDWELSFQEFCREHDGPDEVGSEL